MSVKGLQTLKSRKIAIALITDASILLYLGYIGYLGFLGYLNLLKIKINRKNI